MKSIKIAETLQKEFEQQFVQYEEAKQLSQLPDFNEAFMPIGYYTSGADIFGNLFHHQLDLRRNAEDSRSISEIISAPLWQQAFDWFAETYGYEVAFDRRHNCSVTDRNSKRLATVNTSSGRLTSFTAIRHYVKLEAIRIMINLAKQSCQTSE